MSIVLGVMSVSLLVATLFDDLGFKMNFLAPRAGLEPATKRLTAAHSTIELPGNEYFRAIARIRQADFGIF